VAGIRIMDLRVQASAARFSHSIAFNFTTAESYLHEFEDLGSNWCSSTGNHLDISTKELFHLVENKSIIDFVRHNAMMFQIIELGGNCLVN
jgi:hypothetical protein